MRFFPVLILTSFLNSGDKMENTLETANAPKRVEWVDIAKGIGMILVIIGHLSVPYTDLWIYTFHMPLFFFLSGAVFSGAKYRFSVFLKKKVKSLVIPYFALGFGIFLFFSALYLYYDNTGNIPPDFVKNALDTPSNMFFDFLIQKGYWTVWFLACLFVAEIMFYFIIKLSRNTLWITVTVSSVICLGGLIYYRCGGVALPWNIDIALTAQFFICIGYAFSNSRILGKFASYITKDSTYPKRFLTAALFLAINAVTGFASFKLSGSSVNMSVGTYGIEVLTIISALSGILFVVSVSSMIKSRFLSYLGRNTMLVFAWHSRIMIIAFNYLYGAIGIFQSDGFAMKCVYAVVTTIGILAVLMPLDYLIQKSPLRFMVGRSKK